MEDKTLNSQESLELITRMIAETRGKLERGGGTILLIWGYTTILVSAAVLISVNLTQNYLWQWLWWAIPVIGYTLMYLFLRNKPKPVRTYIDKFISNIWITIGIVALIFPIVGMFSAIAHPIIIPFEALMLSVGVIITGMTIKFKTLTVCGFISLALSFLMYFITEGYTYVFIAMFVVGMIIPGHVLNHKGRCSKS